MPDEATTSRRPSTDSKKGHAVEAEDVVRPGDHGFTELGVGLSTSSSSDRSSKWRALASRDRDALARLVEAGHDPGDEQAMTTTYTPSATQSCQLPTVQGAVRAARRHSHRRENRRPR